MKNKFTKPFSVSMFILVLLFFSNSFKINAQCGTNQTEIILTVSDDGSWQNERFWQLIHTASNDTILQETCDSFVGGTFSVCLNNDEQYVFMAHDKWGDGWNSGTVEVAKADGCVIFYNMPDNLNDPAGNGCDVADVEMAYYFEPNQAIIGCTDPDSFNYNPCATISGSHCMYDNCVNAIPLTVNHNLCVAYETGNNFGSIATPQTPSPSCGDYQGGDVWFSAVMPESDSLVIQLDVGAFNLDGNITAYTGTCGNLTEIACNTGTFLSITGQTAGEMLYLRVWDTANDEVGFFTICATDPEPVLACDLEIVSLDATCYNDDNVQMNLNFAGTGTYNVHLNFYTVGENYTIPNLSAGNLPPTFVYPHNAPYTITISNTNDANCFLSAAGTTPECSCFTNQFEFIEVTSTCLNDELASMLPVFTGLGNYDLSIETVNPDTGVPSVATLTNTTASFVATNGLPFFFPQNTFYTLTFESLDSPNCTFTTSGTTAACGCFNEPPPFNDECSDALPLVTGTNGPFDNNCATADPGGTEPEAPDCFTDNNSGLTHTVWFSFVGTGQNVRLTATDGGDPNLADYENDLQLAVYTGTCGSWTEIACGDDEVSYQPQVVFSTEVGTTYSIMVDGWGQSGTGSVSLNGNTGTFFLEIENLSLTPEAIAVCENAYTINLDSPCEISNNIDGMYSGPAIVSTDSLGSDLWFKFTAPTSGNVLIETQAEFNDAVTIYSGTCSALTQMSYHNDDEFGFEGESVYLSNLAAAQNYYLRISGVHCTFGVPEGNLCLQITSDVTAPSVPINDLCTANVPELIMDTPCISGVNAYATYEINSPIPYEDTRTRSSVWYQFAAPPNGTVLLANNADFSAVMRVFSGTCSDLTLFAESNENKAFLVENLSHLQVYFVEITGNFSTIEGDLCVALNTPPNSSTNTACLNPTTLLLNDACTTDTNQKGIFDGPTPSCEPLPDGSLWYQFTAPTSGEVVLQTGADFIHLVAVYLYTGSCETLEEVGCHYNPPRCGDGVELAGLIAGETYYIQIMSAPNSFGYTYGEACVSVSDMANRSTVTAQIKVFLEGAYASNQQMTSLLPNAPYHLLPLDQPYWETPWSYEAVNSCVTYIPPNAVDWVLVELRNAADNFQIVASKAALLLGNGTLTDNRGTGVTFNAPQGNYYIVIRHRNHLDIMSEDVIALPNEIVYDFSDPVLVAEGMAQLTQMPDGIYGMSAGDFNGDGIVSITDFNFYQSQVLINTYFQTDCTLDGHVTIADFNKYQPNASKIGIPQVRY